MTDKHLSEEQMSMHVFGDADNPAEVADHLKDCEACAKEFARLQQVVNLVSTIPVPERGEEYGAQVWQRIRYRLPERELPWFKRLFAPQGLAFAAGALALVFIAFMAGRVSGPAVKDTPTQANAQDVKERVVLVAVGRHLEKTQMVLVELSNAEANGKLDISMEQALARDLVDNNRLYRQSAANVGEQGVTSLLDEVERFLVEVANGPSELNPQQLKNLQERMEAQGLLFKVRVVGSTVQHKQKELIQPAVKGAGRT